MKFMYIPYKAADVFWSGARCCTTTAGAGLRRCTLHARYASKLPNYVVLDRSVLELEYVLKHISARLSNVCIVCNIPIMPCLKIPVSTHASQATGTRN